MADVFEQNLPSKANLNVGTTGDYLRVVGNDNNSYKQLVNDVAKKIIENYTNSSLAGSNQSVKSALNALNSNLGEIINNGTDFNTLVLPANDKKIKVYRGENLLQMTNKPSDVISAWPFCLMLLPIGGSYTKQILHIYGNATTPDYVYVRTQTYLHGEVVWTDWQQSPTRVEIDALNSKSQKIVSSNTSITLSLSASSVYLLVLLNDGGSSQYRNVSVIATSASGGTILPLADSAQVTASLSGLSLSITRTVYASGVLYKLA